MKHSKKSKVIILLGPPGSGKGTQAELLTEKLNLYYFETSKILEEKFSQAKKGEFLKIDCKIYNLLDEKKLWETGILCSPPFVTHLVKEKIKELFKERKNLVLSGSPRTLYEGKEIFSLLKKLYGKENIKLILLQQSEKTTILRNNQRKICQLMRHPILSTKKEFLKLTHCPLDGSKLVKRKGLDDPETIKVRLKEYRERTFPLVDYFKKEGLKVKEVNGEQSVADVFRDILKVI
jgi:adenylate kinase